MIIDFSAIDEPIPISSLRGNLFAGKGNILGMKTIFVNEGRISDINDSIRSQSTIISDSTLILPGRIDLHCHGRDVFGIKPGEDGDQSHKEDSYTLGLAMAQGGATHAVCMPNLGRFIETQEDYDKQVNYINSAQPHRRKPIMDLSMYVLVRPNSKPQVKNAIYKLMWNTFGPTNFTGDEEVPPTLANYTGQFVTAHCESIAGIIKDASLPHHEQRPTKAAIDAVKIFLDSAEKYRFHAHVAHISSAEEVKIVREYKDRGVSVSCEVTPQSITLNYDDFRGVTNLPIKWLQQNPPVRSRSEMIDLRNRLQDIDVLATDHAPHTIAECEKGISGKVQAPTAGQVYLEHVRNGHMTLSEYVEKSSSNPGRILEKRLGLRIGRIESGYDASFTLVSFGKPSRIRNDEVLSKPRYTPYENFNFSNTIEGVVIKGVLYTQKVLQKLR